MIKIRHQRGFTNRGVLFLAIRFDLNNGVAVSTIAVEGEEAKASIKRFVVLAVG